VAQEVSPELRAPFPAALCHGASGPERRQRLTGVESCPSPRVSASSVHHQSDAPRPAGAHVALDAMPRAEPANILGADFESEGFEMRPDVASSVGLAGIPEHEEQGMQLPTVLVSEGSPTSCLVVAIFKKAERFGEIAEQSLTPDYTTSPMKTAQTIDIELLDHLILGDKTADPTGQGFYSFRQAGLL
jgi:hypothetical protein